MKPYQLKVCQKCGTEYRQLSAHLPKCPERDTVGGVAGP